MLDLDSLAESRAKALSQPEAAWRETLWNPIFQRISQNMSDGDIEELLHSCASVNQLRSVIVFIEQFPDRAAPFSLIQQEAKRQGLELRDWIQTLPEPGQWNG